jgi:hypothetical protein
MRPCMTLLNAGREEGPAAATAIARVVSAYGVRAGEWRLPAAARHSPDLVRSTS